MVDEDGESRASHNRAARLRTLGIALGIAGSTLTVLQIPVLAVVPSFFANPAGVLWATWLLNGWFALALNALGAAAMCEAYGARRTPFRTVTVALIGMFAVGGVVLTAVGVLGMAFLSAVPWGRLD